MTFQKIQSADSSLHNQPQSSDTSNVLATKGLLTRAKLAFFLLGLLNNCGSVIVLSAASDLAKRFSKGHMMSLFSGCLNLFSVLITVINAKYLLKVPHRTRVAAANGIFVAGLLCIMSAILLGSFEAALFGSMLIGIGCACGSMSIQGFMKEFPPEVFGGFASGTGGAGLFGSVYYLTLKISHIDASRIFLFLFPVYVLYHFTFAYAVKLKSQFDSATEQQQAKKDQPTTDSSCDNQTLSWELLPLLLQKMGLLAGIFGLVYFLQYSCFGYLASTACSKLTGSDLHITYSFEIIQCCYQLGVFIARSSIHVIRVRQPKAFLLLQASFFLTFTSFALFIKPQPALLFGAIFCTGVVGGLSYSNTIYAVLSDASIARREKELALNIVNISSSLGIVSSSVSGYFFKTFITSPIVIR
jgi:battenin